ncbi:unnamed protein product [Angiostrongylus costaricensis]|uniref:Latrophilin Cirl n=1 Tax=Angiostrongylus costaricensis TaxID=334426 RepID=A0A158PHA3_ANGCS|nr:unnamed protein product [Angiostrongylus costaricensis]
MRFSVILKYCSGSIVVCEGGTAELVCPRGTVISISLANYGRYSARVCYENEELDVVVPMTQCHNPKTVPALQKRCEGLRRCKFMVDAFMFDDPCPETSKYLEREHLYLIPTDDYHSLRARCCDSSTSAKSTTITCAATSRRGIEWPVTVAETTVNRPCPEGTSSWRCTSEGFWSESEPNTMGCQSDWTTQRHDALEETIKDQDSSGIPELLRAMTSDTRRPMVAGDLPKLLDILDIIQDIMDREPWAKNSQKLVNQLIVNVVHNTLRAKEIWQNWPLTKRQVFATRLLACVERAMTSSSVTIHSSENYVQPLVMTEMSESIRTSAQQSSYFLFPSMALWAGENNVDSVDIPKEAMEITGMVYYASFANIGEQMQPPVQKLPASEQLPTGGERRRRVISRVVAASIVLDGKSVRFPVLPKPVRVIITFHHHPEALRRMTSPECSWWDAENFKWSSSGCSLQSHNSTHTICNCNHMTHYAVLMDLVGHNRLLTILTYGGCGLSIICLAITFLCFVVFVKGGGDRVFIHKNLCVSLGVAELVFLLGIWRTEEKFECSVIAGCLLYFFLSALTWMLLEGYQLYQMLVEVIFPTARRRRTFFFIGYGLPAVITGAAALYDRGGFGTRYHCWLRTDNLFILFFVVPAAVILIVNTIFLFMTMCVVYRHSKYIPCRHASDHGGAIRTWVKGSMGLVCLLGVTWTCGLLWIDDGHSIVMAYAFTIANSLQGLFIFLFHVVFFDKVRKNMYFQFNSASKDHHKENREAISPSDKSGTGICALLFHLEYLYSITIVPMISGTYDYATIAYGEMVPGHMIPRKLAYPHPNVAVHLFRYHYHRPPPDFSPPPPPDRLSQQAVRQLFASARPPSSKLSDDSAYSDGGSSSVLTTEVTPSGTTVLRMELVFYDQE